MSRTLSEFVAQIGPRIGDTTGGTVTTNAIRDSLNNCINHLIKDHGIYATKNRAYIDIFPSVYEYSVPSDFFDAINIQRNTSPRDLLRITPEDFWANINSYSDVFAIDSYRSSHTILIKTSSTSKSAVLNACESTTDNGTWAAEASTDAVNITTETVNQLAGAGAIAFDVDVSNSGNNYAAVEVTGMTQVDISDYLSRGSVLLDIYIPSATYITSVTLRWGNDSSNYYSQTATTQHNGLAIRDGVNTFAFNQSTATETGTVTDTAIDYLNVRVTYSASQADASGFIVDNIRIENPYRVELHYYSTSFVQDGNDSTYVSKFTNTSDASLLDDADDDILLNWALADAFLIKQQPADRAEFIRLYEAGVERLKTRYNSEKKREVTFYR